MTGGLGIALSVMRAQCYCSNMLNGLEGLHLKLLVKSKIDLFISWLKTSMFALCTF